MWIGAFAALAGLLAGITALTMYGTSEGLFLALALAALIGLGIVLAAGMEVWLPAIFTLSLLVLLNKTIADLPVTLYSFDPTLVLLYAVWLWQAWRGEARGLRLTEVDYAGMVFLAWLLIASLFGQDVGKSLGGWLLYVRGFLVYFYFAHALRFRRQLWSVVLALLVLVAVQSGLALLQYITRSNIGSVADMVGSSVGAVRRVPVYGGSLFRVRGTLNTDTSLAHWLEMLLPLVLAFWLMEQRTSRRWRAGVGLIVLFAVGIAAQIATFTRGGWIGLATGVVVVLGLALRGRLVRDRCTALTLLSVLLLLGLVLAFFHGPIMLRLFRSAENTLRVRSNLDQVALQMIQTYPLTGIGLDNFVSVAPRFGVGWQWETQGKLHKVHNVYLALATEAGPLALLLFGLLLAGLLRRAWRLWQWGGTSALPWANPLGVGLLGGLVAVMVHGLVAWGLLSYSVFPLFWLLAGLLPATAQLALGKER